MLNGTLYSRPMLAGVIEWSAILGVVAARGVSAASSRLGSRRDRDGADRRDFVVD